MGGIESKKFEFVWGCLKNAGGSLTISGPQNFSGKKNALERASFSKAKRNFISSFLPE